MAAASVTTPHPIDLKTSASYPIRLGASITKPADAQRQRQYTSLRYNYKPRLRNSKDVKATINALEKNKSRLKLRHAGDQYGYDGEQTDAGDSYVLVLQGAGKEQEVLLEKVGSSHVLNLVSAPQASSEQLAKRYPHISLDENEDDGAAGDDDAEEEAADPDNPFDYRHFLKAATAEKARRPDLERSQGSTGTPLVQARAATTTPASRPANSKRESNSVLVQPKKRKAPAAAEKPTAKRVKATQEAPSPKADTSRAQPPKIRVDRKASLRRPSVDDDGELILENETPVSEKLQSRHNAMSLALSGQLGHQGPISLRSAANSPASQIASPMPPRPAGVESDGEFEIGGSNSPEDAPLAPRREAAADDGEDVDDDDEAEFDEEDADADVEDLELPSPATEHKPSISATTVTAADEDDLDAQLAAAMAEEDDGGVADEEEEESEEE